MSNFTFTTEQLALIDQQSLPASELPTYTLASSCNNATPPECQPTPISLDFEYYLILQPAQQKQDALSWIQMAGTITTNNTDRDAIINRYCTLRKSDAAARVAQISQVMQNYEKFRAGLLAGSLSVFSGVIEVGLLADSLQKPMDEIALFYDQAFQEQALVTVLQTRYDLTDTSMATDQELESWQTVLTTFAGTSTASGSAPGSSLTPITQTLTP